MQLRFILQFCLFFSAISLYGQIQIGQNLSSYGGTYFGGAIDATYDGSRIVVGASGGKFAQVYDFDGTNWIQIVSDIVYDVSGFGGAVTIDATGQYLAIASTSYTQVNIYKYNDNDWQLIQEMPFDGEVSSSNASIHFSADAEILTLGLGSKSEIRTYKKENEQWTDLKIPIIGEENSDIGIRFTISSDASTLSCYNAKTGAIEVYRYNIDNWELVDKYTASWIPLLGFPAFSSLTKNGKLMAVGYGSWIEDEKCGKVLIFDISNESITPVDSIVSIDCAYLGMSVSIDETGSKLVQTSIDGMVIQYERNSSNKYIMKGSIISSLEEGNISHAVYSQDGNRVFIGESTYEESGTSNKGLVRCFGSPIVKTSQLKSTALTIFPNPTPDIIQLDTRISSGELTIYSASGEHVYIKQFSSVEEIKVISCRSFGSGVYFARIADDQTNQVEYSRFIVY